MTTYQLATLWATCADGTMSTTTNVDNMTSLLKRQHLQLRTLMATQLLPKLLFLDSLLPRLAAPVVSLQIISQNLSTTELYRKKLGSTISTT